MQVFDATGAFVTKFGSFLVGGLTTGLLDEILVADRDNDRVRVFLPSGSMDSSFGAPGSLDGQFDDPLGISVSVSARIFVTDRFNSRVQVFTSGGAFASKFGSFGASPGQFGNFGPQGLTEDGSGRILVADPGNHRVQVFIIDADSDGLSDDVENALGTDPLDPDTDDDGLLDGTEVDMAQGAGCPNPLDPDSDSDLILDGDEVASTGPGDPSTDPCNSDTDGDGLGDLIDADPITPSTSSGALEDSLRIVAAELDGFDLSLFTGANANSNSGRRNSMSSRVRQAANAIGQGNNSAAVALLSSVLSRVDGQGKDWMISSPERGALDSWFSSLLQILT